MEDNKLKQAKAREMSGRAVKRLLKRIGHSYMARYYVDENVQYWLGYVEDAVKYEKKQEYFKKNFEDEGLKKVRSLVYAPDLKDALDDQVALNFFFVPLSAEDLEKPVTPKIIDSADRLRRGKRQGNGTGKRGRKATSSESFTKWVAALTPAKVSELQKEIGMTKLHREYEVWCSKNDSTLAVVNIGKFWVEMKKAGLHTSTRKTTQVATDDQNQVAI